MSRSDYSDWIGRAVTRSDTISLFPARALAALLQRPQPPELGAELSPGWQWLYFLDTPRPDGTGEDGHPRRGGFLPPIALERRMWAAGEFEITYPLIIGEAAEKTSTVQSITPKFGASGEMIFIVLEHITRQGGRDCIRELQTLVYRAMPTAPSPRAAGNNEPGTPEWSADAATDPVTLFRYSALTFNGHRIHYDSDYARNVEHYPGLVVQGPLLATLLLNHVQMNRPDEPSGFRFRAVSPAFSGDSLTLHGRDMDGKTELWAATPQGVSMLANATFKGRAS